MTAGAGVEVRLIVAYVPSPAGCVDLDRATPEGLAGRPSVPLSIGPVGNASKSRAAM